MAAKTCPLRMIAGIVSQMAEHGEYDTSIMRCLEDDCAWWRAWDYTGQVGSRCQGGECAMISIATLDVGR